MNLHGYLASQRIHYGSPEAIDFTSAYFAATRTTRSRRRTASP